jgi:hypothetical protein
MRCSLGVLIFLVLSCLPPHAQDQEQANSPRRWLEVGQGIVCDTPAQVERFVALRDGGRDVTDALQTVNNGSHDSTACDVTLVAFTDSKPIAERVIQGKLASVIK